MKNMLLELLDAVQSGTKFQGESLENYMSISQQLTKDHIRDWESYHKNVQTNELPNQVRYPAEHTNDENLRTIRKQLYDIINDVIKAIMLKKIHQLFASLPGELMTYIDVEYFRQEGIGLLEDLNKCISGELCAMVMGRRIMELYNKLMIAKDPNFRPEFPL
jgi:hypothetical protein